MILSRGKSTRVRVLLAVLVVAIVGGLKTPAPASAKFCGDYPYADPSEPGYDGFHFPTVDHIRVKHTGCKTGYRVARGIRRGNARINARCEVDPEHCPEGNYRLPRHVRVRAKRFTCRYVEKQGRDNPYLVARCRHGARRARMILGS